jgi:hypothetical protein
VTRIIGKRTGLMTYLGKFNRVRRSIRRTWTCVTETEFHFLTNVICARGKLIEVIFGEDQLYCPWLWIVASTSILMSSYGFRVNLCTSTGGWQLFVNMGRDFYSICSFTPLYTDLSDNIYSICSCQVSAIARFDVVTS